MTLGQSPIRAGGCAFFELPSDFGPHLPATKPRVKSIIDEAVFVDMMDSRPRKAFKDGRLKSLIIMPLGSSGLGCGGVWLLEGARLNFKLIGSLIRSWCTLATGVHQ